ncbi:septum site-determining protein MinC [Alcaligenaceae bacterium]|nr:septum site-determining protein MinC [Alcaligenaceae bacterium]
MSDSSTHRKGQSALDFKSATLYALRVVLRSADTAALIAALDQRMRDAGSFFDNEPIVIDASHITDPIDWVAFTRALNAHNLHQVGVVAQGSNLDSAQACGLIQVDLANPVQRPASPPVAEQDVPVVAPNSVSQNAARPSSPPAVPEVAPAAMVINRQLRSGQRIYARNTDLIVIGAVGQGAEIIADGNIHVYGPLRGKAMAGARGDSSARIFTTQLDPELLAIAGVYRVIETRLDPSLLNQPTIVQLDGDQLKITSLGK